MDSSLQTIRLEARYSGQQPRGADFKCRSVEWIEATWHDMIGADGPAVRSIVEGPRLIASGLSDFDVDAGWNWIIHPKRGEHEIMNVERRGGEVRFVLR
jgi:hypothetical protein